MVLDSTVEKLCALGCNVIVNYSDYLPASLEKFTAISAKKNGTLTIKKCSKALPTSLERLAAIGKEHVTLDLTE